VAPATLASRSCAEWEGSSPKAAPSGTSSAGVGRLALHFPPGALNPDELPNKVVEI